ncbi:hypothetical protein ACNQGB_08995 [Flavobacterium sp. XS1P32]|uniref:hypothetical protein n=1 Tax=Flavobacterium sp. XS1P32 TaxID=3401726 RepID=UPI003AAC6203
MKLNYNIIWVDDKIDTRPYKSIKKEIFNFITEEFFNCKIEEAEDFNEFVQLFTDSTTYDLIITDLSLNSGTTGKQVIDYIRDNKHNHTEIFFYSANTQLRQQELINSNRITFYQLTEGNYNELKNEIIDLVKLTISKFQHIVSMRGLIMNEVSSLDAQMLDIVNTYIDNTGEESIINSVIDDLISFHSEKLKNSEKYKQQNNISKVLSDPVLFSSFQRANAIENIINAIGCENFIDDFKTNVIKTRNNFAHAVFIKDKKTGREYFQDKKGGIDFNEEKCRDIRKNINTHKENLDNLQSKIG